MGEGRANRSPQEFRTEDVAEVPSTPESGPAGQVASTLDPRPQDEGGSELNAEEFGEELNGAPDTPRG